MKKTIIFIFLMVFLLTACESSVQVIDNENLIETVLPFVKPDSQTRILIYSDKVRDEREALDITTFVVFSQTPYSIIKGSPLVVSYQSILKVIKVDLPRYDIGKPLANDGVSYRWENEGDQWTVYTIKTSKGVYSRWQRLSR